MTSVLGMLEERETAARVRVEGLREEVARLAGVLEAAEIELDRRVITREELVEALAVSAAETTAVTGAETEQETGSSPAIGPSRGKDHVSSCFSWHESRHLSPGRVAPATLHGRECSTRCDSW